MVKKKMIHGFCTCLKTQTSDDRIIGSKCNCSFKKKNGKIEGIEINEMEMFS